MTKRVRLTLQTLFIVLVLAGVLTISASLSQSHARAQDILQTVEETEAIVLLLDQYMQHLHREIELRHPPVIEHYVEPTEFWL